MPGNAVGEVPGIPENHLAELTGTGWVGAGAELGQHEAARNAVAAAIRAIFIGGYKVLRWIPAWETCQPARETSGRLVPCKAK